MSKLTSRPQSTPKPGYSPIIIRNFNAKAFTTEFTGNTEKT